MHDFRDAVSWDGRKTTLILFAMGPTHASLPTIDLDDWAEFIEVRPYFLEDVDAEFTGQGCFEYDLILREVPANVESLITAWLGAALEAGARVAWFGFEGSFDFAHILTSDVSRQIYAVGHAEGISLALRDHVRHSHEWAQVVAGARAALVVDSTSGESP